MKRRLFTAIPRDQWNSIALAGRLEPEPATTQIDPTSGEIRTRPQGRAWFSDRRRADLVFREQNGYAGTVRVIGVRHRDLPDAELIVQEPGWSVWAVRGAVSLRDIDVTDWQIE
jgi:hypothetical protein